MYTETKCVFFPYQQMDVCVMMHMLEQDEILIMSLAAELLKVKQKRKHRWWAHSILQNRRRQGSYHNLVRELQLDGENFQLSTFSNILD